MSDIDVEVVIIGLGPVGATTANLLGLYGVSTEIFERETSEHGQPRAFSCDDEAMRIYQHIGLAERLRADMFECGEVDYTGSDGKAFAHVLLRGVDFGLGYGPLFLFHQPLLEKTLRQGLTRFAHVRTHLGWELVSLSQEEEHVRLTLRQMPGGELRTVRARYVLGCDGARSAVRALAGIQMTGIKYKEPWLAVSVQVPEDAIRVGRNKFIFIGDPRRPMVAARGALDFFRLEFMLREGETAEQMERPETVRALIAPYVDPARAKITRAAVYTFGNALAEQWRAGRAFLLGDAAHLLTPFMGQGLCSGLRDAANLSWKLAMVLRGDASEALLATYELERRPHLEQMAGVSAAVGKVFLARDSTVAWLRNTLLRAVQVVVPRARRYIQNFEFKPVPFHPRGLMAGGHHTGGPEGEMFPQPHVLTAHGEQVLLDEVLGNGFAVLSLSEDGQLPPERWPVLDSHLPTRFIRVLPPDRVPGVLEAPNAFEVVDLDGKLLAWFHRHHATVALLRPDRFIFAAGKAPRASELGAQLKSALQSH